MAVDAVRLSGPLRGAANGAARGGRGRPGRRRGRLGAVSPHRAVLPAPAVRADPVLPHGRRAACLRPHLHPHRRRAGQLDADAQPLSLPDPVQVLRRRPGGRPGRDDPGGREHPLCAHHPCAARGAALMVAFRTPRRPGRLAAWVILGLAAPIYVLPLYWLLVTSLKSKAELYRGTVTLYPHAPTLEAYSRVLF